MSAELAKKEADELRRHAERLAKALRLLLRCGRFGIEFDAVEFAEDALLAWRKRR